MARLRPTAPARVPGEEHPRAIGAPKRTFLGSVLHQLIVVVETAFEMKRRAEAGAIEDEVGVGAAKPRRVKRFDEHVRE